MAALVSGHRDFPEEKCHPRPDSNRRRCA